MTTRLLTVLFLCLPLRVLAAISVTGLKVENMHNPLGLDTATPRFSWVIEVSDSRQQRDVRQTAYRILVSTTREKLLRDEGDLWDSGDVASNRQLWVPYGGKPLKSGQRAYWKVRVNTSRGQSTWSTDACHFSIGLLGETRWSGRWIGLSRLMPDERAGEQHSRLAARYLRKEFTLQAKTVARATAYISGLGLYQLFINGRRIGTDELTPLPSDYRKTIYYDTYDVTDILAAAQSSQVAVGVVMGNGRYFAMRQDKPYKNTTFGLPKCRMNIIVEYDDGKTQRLVTDETWRITADGPIRANNEYDGEEYDARRDLGSWTLPGYDDSHWLQAERSDIPTGTLRGRPAPNMRVHTSLPSVTATPLPSGAATPLPSGAAIPLPSKGRGQGWGAPHSGSPIILDFGRNLSGHLAFMPYGDSGDTIRLRYAERLNADGTLYTANLRDARSEDIYVCSGREQPSAQWDASAAWRAAFVTHGFRYVEVSGMAHPDPQLFRAEEIYDDMDVAGQFTCSDTILNKVVAAARQGIAANYKGMPIDCPQRNERQPWLGDRTVGALGESFLFANERLYTKWMRDICEAQREDGCIPDVAPAFWNYYTDDVSWPACLPFNCQMLYRQYGNDEAAARSYPYLRRWLLHIMECYTSKDGLITKDKYGDWCVPPEKPSLIHNEDPARITDGTLIATAYTIRCLDLARQMATRLLRQPDAGVAPADTALWHSARQRLAEAFNRHFLTCRQGTSPRPGHPLYPDSVYYGNNTTTANLLPLAFDICPDSLRREVAKQVVENIVVRNQLHVSCGVIGISWLLTTLTNCGFGDVAYALATQRTYPSWGYMTEHGATTIWELWNGDTADPAMNSGNHVMLLGDLLTWCYQYLGGLQQTDGDSAYRHLVLKPDFTIQDCDSVRCEFHSPYGYTLSQWRKTRQHLDWHVVIPCNTTAELHFPDGSVQTCGSGAYDFSVAIPTRDPAILADEFVCRDQPFVSPHASTIVETRRGDLVCAYFAGTYERNPDCCIYVSIKEHGSNQWTVPIRAADGIFPDTQQLPCWNPVLFEMPDGELWLFFKIGKSVKEWTGWLTRSTDGGHTWLPREPLPDGFLGPVKNKPIIVDNRLVCGSSTEGDGWRFHVELLDLATRQWQYVGPVESTMAVKTDDNAPHPIDCIQPSLLRLADGRLQVLMRTHNAWLATSTSSDGGLTWTPVTLSSVMNNQSGTDAVTLSDGRHVLVYNDFETLPNTKKGPRTPLSVAVSSDGQHWRHWLTLEDSPLGEFSYPAIVEGRDKTLHITYTWRRKQIIYKNLQLYNNF